MIDPLLRDLFHAYYCARTNKRNSLGALAFELHYEKNLFELYHEIKNGQYQIGPSVAFIIFDPVQREIIASSFRDRVVHHLVFNYLNPLFEPRFIHDSYSCRQNKGTSYGITRLAHFIRACSNNYKNQCYVLKLDLAGYFMSINHHILFDKIVLGLEKNRRPYQFDLTRVLALVHQIVFHNYTSSCSIRGLKTD